MTGHEYADLVARYVVRNWGGRGVTLYREVFLGKTIIGKDRRVDLLIVEPGSGVALAIECKYQGSTGTTEEKIPYTLEDMASIGMPWCVVYAGDGFSDGIRHMLAAAPHAAYCMPDGETLVPSGATRELDVVLAMTFRWWDLVVRGKKPLERAE
jgi:hypothetical protein